MTWGQIGMAAAMALIPVLVMVKRQALSTLQQQLTEGQRKVLATMTGDLSAWLAGTIQRTLVEHRLDVAAATGPQALPLLEAAEFVNPQPVPVSPAS